MSDASSICLADRPTSGCAGTMVGRRAVELLSCRAVELLSC